MNNSTGGFIKFIVSLAIIMVGVIAGIIVALNNASGEETSIWELIKSSKYWPF